MEGGERVQDKRGEGWETGLHFMDRGNFLRPKLKITKLNSLKLHKKQSLKNKIN